jgi:diacylglycerol kinase family enzyme
MRRLLLISNEQAHRVTGYRREVIARALSAEFKVEEAQTTAQGHAIQVAREAASDGIEVVAALGGDGTVNEVVNGLAGTDAALAILPAGMANVFARSLGIPNDPVEATGWLLGQPDLAPKRIPLGRVDGRHFTVSCGVGFDAAVVREVERRQRAKRRGGEWFFVRTGLRVFLRGYDRRTPHVRVAWGQTPLERREGQFLAVFQNASPYTYLGQRPLRLCPEASLEGELDCLMLDTLRTSVTARLLVSAFGSGRHVRRKHVTYVPGRPRFEVAPDQALPVQVDGEFLGESRELLVDCVPDALNVLF